MTSLSIKKDIPKKTLEGVTIPYSAALRYTAPLKWNEGVFETKDPVACPITDCMMYNIGCGTPITSIIKVMFLKTDGNF